MLEDSDEEIELAIKKTKINDEFQNEWPEYKQEKFPKKYQEQKLVLENALNREDIISKNKSERFIKTFVRLSHHYAKSNIESYIGELDNFLHMNIPVVKTEEDITGDLLKEFQGLVSKVYDKSEKEVEI